MVKVKRKSNGMTGGWEMSALAATLFFIGLLLMGADSPGEEMR